MTQKILSRLLIILFVFGISLDADAQRRKKKNKKDPKQTVKPTPKPKPKKGAILPYEKVVTKKHKTDKGLFSVHTKDEKYLFEIPDSLIGREMLMVTRIAKTANGIGFGGGKQNTQVLRWEKKGKKILLRVVSHNVVADKDLPVHEAVLNSNFEPILFSFPIKAFNKDSTATVIDATPLFTTDVKPLGFPTRSRKRYKISRMDAKRSFIERITSYPKNIEIRHVKTYAAGAAPSNRSLGSISLEMSNSMILLPKVPMKRRYFDERVGWFARSQVDYSESAQKSKTLRYLDRYRLEVKDEDIAKFKRGELVEPKKQIVYYVDRATPEEWVPFIIKGVNDWQVAFEAAGFKNAIIAKRAPTKEEDPEYSPEDVRYSVIRYLASPIPNANGPHVSDPRSGEILESDINWYHNVMSLLQGWFFVQTAAINPEAQKVGFKTEVMGELIKFVSSHELGHTLGLPHNMGSSSAYPVDSLRSATFTKKFGTAPSIMDYARFNYIAQPGDKGVALMPNIGIYDKHAINWGYRPILGKTAKQEKPILDSWILKHAGDPMYRFGRNNRIDPSSQTEDLGDDGIKASNYGIANLKRIVPNLMNWTSKKGENYTDLKAMYGHVLSQFGRYNGHVTTIVGGVIEDNKTSDQAGVIYTQVAKERQKAAVKFLNDQLFKTPTWVINKAFIDRTESSGVSDRIKRLQSRTLRSLLSSRRMVRMIDNQTLNGSKAYTVLSMMYDVRRGVWTELYSRKSIDTYRRNLQRTHIGVLGNLMSKGADISDVKPIVRGELNRIKRDTKRAIATAPNTLTRYHLQDIVERIDTILDPK
ncbi:MAG: zinc-dependent metalloprotease [Flavobacteriaceae bacterium]|nr:zinc-dependent metalloprotease [Flavobacteriaceae bacterium]